MKFVTLAVILFAANTACSGADFQVSGQESDSGPGADSGAAPESDGIAEDLGPGPDGCKRMSKVTACAGRECGTVSDGCDGLFECGTCPSMKACGSSGVCGCSPKAPAEVCGSQNCGTAPDGCGSVVNCGTCSKDTAMVCGLTAPGKCGLCPLNPDTQCCPPDPTHPCWSGGHTVPRKCPYPPALSFTTCLKGPVVGSSIVYCCEAPSGSCTPLTKSAACGIKSCGARSDGCGGLIDCGTCSAGLCNEFGLCP